MRGPARAACLLFVFGSRASAKPPARTAPHGAATSPASSAAAAPAPREPARPPAPLPMLASVARADVEVAHDHVLVVEEVRLPRGDWHGGGLDLYISFGAPGVPQAVDARIGPAPESLEDPAAEGGAPVAVEPAFRRWGGAQLLLGRPQMAGVVVRLKEADLRQVYAASQAAALRIRSLLGVPAADAHGARDVVVRLGIAGELPLTVGRVVVTSLEPAVHLERAEASLCGPEADSHPLAVTLVQGAAGGGGEGAGAGARSMARAAGGVGPIAPVMAVRHASDDLCVRWWSAP